MPLDIDRFSHIESTIQRWDPRVKIASLAILIFGVALLKTLPMSVAALVMAFILMTISALPYHFVMHSMQWVILFLLPFFLILPFSYPGAADNHLLGLSFTWEGLRLATLIFVKALAIVLTSFALFGSARFDISMIALQRLKCPPMLIQMLLFTYRYTYTLLEEMRRMNTSMKARGFVPGTNGNTLRTYGNFVGTLLVRSFERTERIYKAMLSKGYRGEFHTLVTFRSGITDYVKAVIVLIVAAGLVVTDFSGHFSVATDGWY
ncbi:MAG: cobalt/nickel transport system permease protein [Gammaproteobacteria bacterium]|nr:MAG: cobalt/nickel transport system permease protein [Gammaproteobacteria bacterium]TND06766.1 MAG: cobalt/nickel transport system permease protein [Gammaproteobacteria bacterium]